MASIWQVVFGFLEPENGQAFKKSVLRGFFPLPTNTPPHFSLPENKKQFRANPSFCESLRTPSPCESIVIPLPPRLGSPTRYFLRRFFGGGGLEDS